MSFAWEKIDDLLADGLNDLLVLDWQEVEGESVAMDVDWDRVRQLERLGFLRIYVARRARRIVGYNTFVVMPRMESRGFVQAVNRQIYVLPAERGIAGYLLVKGAEKGLKERGVGEIIYGAKVASQRVAALFERMGYAPIESLFSKRL